MRRASSSPSRETLIEIVTDSMLSAGLSLIGRPHARRDRRPLSREAGARRRARPAGDASRCCGTISPSPARRCRRSTHVEQLAAPHGFDLDGRRSRICAAISRRCRRSADVVIFDASFSPRLDYYTGIVFEMTGRNGDVLASGGQYDRLLERLGATAPHRRLGLRALGRPPRSGGAHDEQQLTLAVPSKGRLEELTRERLRRRRRCHRPPRRRPLLSRLDREPARRSRCASIPAAEIARELIRGAIDIGVTGLDLIHETSENGPDSVHRSPSRSASARPMSSSPCPTPGSTSPRCTISPTSPPISAPATAAGCASPPSTSTSPAGTSPTHGIAEYRIVESLGATEAAPASGAADLIVDITTTGSTLAANALRVLEDGVILKSEAHLIVSNTAKWTPKRHAALNAVLAKLG